MTLRASLKDARAAKEQALEMLAPMIGRDVSIGITRLDDDGFGLKINLDSEPDAGLILPDDVDGVPIRFEIVGVIRKLEKSRTESGNSVLSQTTHESTDDQPPLANANEWFLITQEWFHEPSMRDNPEFIMQMDDFRERVKSHHPSARIYPFLPIISIELNTKELAAFKEDPYVRWVVKPVYSIDSAAPVLKAFNALRSQTAHQMFQWANHIQAGGTLPDEAWEGGKWPVQAGYPCIDRNNTSQIRFDEEISVEVPPAIMPVVNLSLGPNGDEYFGAGDPLTIAQLAVSGTHLLVVAAGNTNGRPAQPWARAATVISVGATEDKAGKRLATYSPIGRNDDVRSGPDVVAYGASPFEGEPGTSFAAPRVATLAAICQAAIAQLQRIWAVCSGRPNAGVPLVGVGMVDQNLHNSRPRLDLPGLPFVGVKEMEVRENFSALIDAEVSLRFEIKHEPLKSTIVNSARKMKGYSETEVGAGFVSLDGLIGWLCDRNLAEIIDSWSQANLPVEFGTQLGKTQPFDPVGLKTLADVVIKSRPVWLYDLQKDSFTVNRGVPVEQFETASNRAREQSRSEHGHADAVMWSDP